MPRYFAPTNGFTDKNIIAIRLDPGDGYPTSHELRGDGSERNMGAVARHNIWTPTWTEAEMETLVANGTWRELKDDEIPASQRQQAKHEPERPSFVEVETET